MKISQIAAGHAYLRAGDEDRARSGGVPIRKQPSSPSSGPDPAPLAARRAPSHDDVMRQVEAIEHMREQLSSSHRTRLQIDRNENDGKFIYSLVNPDTGEVLRRWPPEGYNELTAYLRSNEGGLIDARV